MTDATFRPSVSVILLTWNQRDLTLDCLASLRQLDYPAEKLNVIVVDNGSHDDTVTAIRECFPEVTVLENGDNLGFAEGNNVGIHHAMGGATDYVMLLNNDTIVDNQMLSLLIDTIERDPTIGVVTPKILYHDEPNRIWCAGASVDWISGRSVRLCAEQIDERCAQSTKNVDFASGCAMLWRRKVIDEVGVLDARFFIYFEEADWCIRARNAGWRIVYQPSTRIWHRISSAMGTASPATDYYMNRNVLLFISKHRKGLLRLASLAHIVSRSMLTIAAYSVKTRNGTRRRNRDALILALRDAILGRWGRMGADVAAVCYPGRG